LKLLSVLKEDWTENLLYPGVVPLLLALFAFVRRGREAKMRAFGFMGLASFILALGTTLHIFGKRVLIGRFPVSLPILPLFLVFPIFGSMRVWTRFGVMTVFAVAVLAGFGLVELLARFKKKRAAFLSATLLVLVLFDFLAVPLPMSKAEPRPVDLWLA
jgi:asparagine N-glycosylation enzyme membrane subunit Stt3